MKRILFVCSQNKLRSPTAEQVFSNLEGIEVLSAGTNNDAVTPLNPELIAWADTIIVMENTHRSKIKKKYKEYINGKSIINLSIPDNYAYMDEALIKILKNKVPQFLL